MTTTSLVSIDASDEQKALESLLPVFRDKRKTDYLVLRSVNFTHREALKAVGVTDPEYQGWKVYDAVFIQWESSDLRKLQRHVGSEVLRAYFMRNVFLQLAIDSQLLSQRAFDNETMTDQDREDAREAAKRYSASNVSAMVKVLDVDQPDEANHIKVELILAIGSEDVDGYTSKKILAKKLLAQFERKEVIDQDGNIVDIEN